MVSHSSTFAWKIPWMEECGRLQSMGSQRVGHNWATSLSLSLATLTWVSIVVLFPSLHVGHPLGFAPEAAFEDLGLPQWESGVEVVQLLESWGFWQHQVLRGVGGLSSQKYSALEEYGEQYWSIHSSILAWRTSLTAKPDRPQTTGLQRVGHDLSDPACIDTSLLWPVATLPQWGLRMKVLQLLGSQGP